MGAGSEANLARSAFTLATSERRATRAARFSAVMGALSTFSLGEQERGRER